MTRMMTKSCGSHTSTAALFTTITFALLTYGSQMAHARPKFPCTNPWVQATAENEFECGTITLFFGDPRVWSLLIPAGIGILVLIPLSCIFLCGRYLCNCCGSAKMRPHSFCGGACRGEDPDDRLTVAQKAPLYGDGCIYIVRALCIFVAVIGIIAFVLNYVGTSLVIDGARDVDNIVNDAADMAVGIINRVRSGIADPVTRVLPDGFDESMFDDAEDTVRGYQIDIKDFYDAYQNIIIVITGVFGYLTIVPAIVLILPVISAVACIRRILPLSFILLSFFFQAIYFVFASLCLLMVLIFAMIHDDAATESVLQRSVKQWYVIPRCEAETPLSTVSDNIAAVEQLASVEACEGLLQVCDNSDVWQNDQRIFFCDLTDPNTCTDFTVVNTIVSGMRTKTGVPAASACGEDAAAQGLTCDIALCATNCTLTSARNFALAANNSLAVATRVRNAYVTLLQPYLSCEVLVDAVLTPNVLDVSAQLRDGSKVLSAGSIMISVALIVAIVVGFLGQKRFLNKKRLMATGAAVGPSDKIGVAPPATNPAHTVAANDGSLSSPYGNEHIRHNDQL